MKNSLKIRSNPVATAPNSGQFPPILKQKKNRVK
nr:MAG TPA: hypothetical protein [Caudoviricetes sp.]